MTDGRCTEGGVSSENENKWGQWFKCRRIAPFILTTDRYTSMF
jgi:hypothetical protein